MFAYKPCPACGCQWRSILCIYDCSQIIALLNMYLLLGGGGSIHCNSAPRVTKSGNTSIKSGNNTPLLIWNRVGLYSPISSKQLSFILKPLWLNWKAAGYLFFAHGICLTLPSASLHFIFSLSLGSPPATWTKKKKKKTTICAEIPTYIHEIGLELCFDLFLNQYNTEIMKIIIMLLVQHGTASSAWEQDLLKKENQELRDRS